nr:hypothetical protein [Desulfitobacterium hafniense]
MGLIYRDFHEGSRPCRLSGVGKAGKAARIKLLPDISHNACLLKPEKQPKDFDLQQGSEFKRAGTKLREKPAAESGWKQDVSNRPLSRSDLATKPGRGFRPSRRATEKYLAAQVDPTERRA